MPNFPPAAPVTSVADDVQVSLYGTLKVERSFSFPDKGGSQAEAEAAVQALCNLSNMGCKSWTFKGTQRYVEDSAVVVRDELYDESQTATLVFQNSSDLTQPSISLRIPAPGAEIFTGGIYVDPDNSLVSTAITATNTFLNSVSGAWVFVSGVKNTATAREKRSSPNIIDPTSGDAEGPGDLA